MNDIVSSVPALILIGAIGIPLIVFLIVGTGEKVIERLSRRNARAFRPWLWLVLPLALVTCILIYPMIVTAVAAFQNNDGTKWVGPQNFIWAFTGEMVKVFGNNVLWLVLFPLGTLVLAILVAVLFDKVRYERFAMTLIVMPTAISFAAGAIMWRQIFSYQAPGSEQLGLLNALVTLIPGAKPVPWLQTPFVNTLCLIFVAMWACLGVAALIISAAVKNVSQEYIEAARLDGASELRIFFSVTVPEIAPSILVVITTQVIFALKIFDIVYVMTNGNFNTSTIANEMYTSLFRDQDLGHASAIALILLVLAIPVVIINIRQFRRAGS